MSGTPVSARPAAIVFSQLLDNESCCAAVVRELSATYDVRPCGPGWPIERLEDVDPSGARFYLELDAVTGDFVRPSGLERLRAPKFAWLVDTHKKLDFHRQLARDMDLTFHAHRAWGHVLEGPRAWLPLHADGEVFRPVEAEREWDVVFVGSQAWRAEPVRRLAERHGLRVLVTCTTGPREKSETAAIYARTRLVFNQHVANDLNFRVFEALACGRVLLTDAQNNGQYELFEDDGHYALFKDERDLERQVLRLLGDDALRVRLERQAARLAHARHTTRARVAQLVGAIEAFLGGAQAPQGESPTVYSCPSSSHAQGAPAPASAAPATAPASAAPAPAAPASAAPAATAPASAAPAAATERRGSATASARPRRVLLLAADDAPTVTQASYGEALASALAARGHEVVVVRQRRGHVVPPPAPRGAPVVVELDPGPLPRGLSAEDRLLLAVPPAHAQVDRVAREHGPFDGVLAEGPLAQHVGPALCQRAGLPLVMLLPELEVVRRGNCLNRPQVYRAELEKWACARAQQVVVAGQAAGEAARRYCGVADPLVVAWPPRRIADVRADVSASAVAGPGVEDRALFAARLGLPERFALVLGRDLGPARRRALCAQGQVLVADLCDPPDAGAGAPVTGLTLPDGRTLGHSAVRGPALAALLTLADVVLLEDAHDPRRLDAERLAARVAVGSLREPGDLERLLAEAQPPAPCARRGDETGGDGADLVRLEDALERAIARTPGRSITRVRPRPAQGPPSGEPAGTTSARRELAHGLR